MEQDKPKNLLILGYTLAICVILVAVVVFVDQYLKADVRQEFEKKILTAPDVEYRDLRATEDGRLGKYTWKDQAKGIVTIPRDRARELVLKEWATRPAGVAKPATDAPPAAPAAGTPGTPGAAGTPGAPADGTAAPLGAGGAPAGSPGDTTKAPGAIAPTPDKDPPGTAQPKSHEPGETPKKGEKQP